jgi:DNA-binding response OmpR family regulator
LVIDDDQLILNLVVRVLGERDYRVSTASTAEIGLELLEQNTFDLILLDLVMPGIGGMCFLDRLPPESKQPIIVMSGESDISSKLNTFDRGAVDYITKPFSTAVLVARIEAKLRRA